MLSYNQACSSSNQCDSSKNLTCSNQLCLCDIYHQWSSSLTTCKVFSFLFKIENFFRFSLGSLILNNTFTYGNTCATGSGQCKSSLDLICPTGTCSCRTGKFWNNTHCVCPLGTFVNSSNLCEPFRRINQSCTVSGNECDTSRDLFCNNSLCQCDFSTKYWHTNFETCRKKKTSILISHRVFFSVPRLNYSVPCSTDSDCFPTLICPTIAGVCNCSQYLADYTCNCANNKYFDPTISQCGS